LRSECSACLDHVRFTLREDGETVKCKTFLFVLFMSPVRHSVANPGRYDLEHRKALP